LKYVLVGCGRMGSSVGEQAAARGHEEVARFDDVTWAAARGGLTDALAGAELAFEFTTPEAAAGNVELLLEAGVAVVCGTTGWRPASHLGDLAERREVGFCWAPNFSVGMNLFYRVVREAARWYGASGLYHPSVFEVHHRHKRDLPSGTARQLGRLIVEADPRSTDLVLGDPRGPVSRDTVHVGGLRVGTEPGTHRVRFDGEHDVITLEHRARSRAGFALGAVLAAEGLLGYRGRHEYDELLEQRLSRGPQTGDEA
jgi:4-hydroxy-tetrahydrodipicolinate reductase